MNKTAVIALKLCGKVDYRSDVDYIGADKGALVLADQGIPMVLAVGDFDSVSDDEFTRIEKASDEVIRLNPIKDDADSEHAVSEAQRRGYEKVILLGAAGRRIDHTIVNLRLALKYAGFVWIEDDYNRIHAVSEGTYVLRKDGYPYKSFFTQEGALVSLEGFQYPLCDRELTSMDLYTVSNELVNAEGRLIVKRGKILIIESRDWYENN